MPHDISLLTNISVALLAAFAGGLLARRVGLPTIVGYLLAGMLIGPFTPGFVGDIDDIRQLAELGVIFLMFGVGLHFSIRALWAVRKVAVPGAVLQMLFAAGLGFALTQFWGWSAPAGLVLGLAISIASTVVLLRGLMDRGLINTTPGQVAVGWLVMEDLATVLILVLLPALFQGEGANPLLGAGTALLKAAVFVGLMLFVGARLLPWLLTWIARTRSRELFILAAVAIALGTALGSAVFFGVSLALGAFLAGVVIAESTVSHQVDAEVLPFRETFAVLFFVSVGMLVNPLYLLHNIGQVVILSALIILGKALITLLIGGFLPASGKTILVVAAGLSQIGEFSFIVGQAGVYLGVLTQDQYSLILSGALLSIMVNPLMYRAMPLVEAGLKRFPRLWNWIDGQAVDPRLTPRGMADHVVVVGYGRVGEHIVDVLERLGVPRLVVEIDAGRAAEFTERGIPTLFGDAANSEVLDYAGLEHARALVVTLPDEAATELVVAAARAVAPNLPIIARATTTLGVNRLTKLGAQDVIHPEFEGGLEVMRHTLLALGYPGGEVQRYADAVRRDQYDTKHSTPEEEQVLEQLQHTVRGMAIAWHTIAPDSPAAGLSLAEANLRARTGASVIALIRDQQLLANPKSSTLFMPGDMIGMIGDSEQIAAAEQYLASAAPGVHALMGADSALGAVEADALTTRTP
jgi:CPA2 family monovalent cation:H+ antiporter-2